MSDPQTPAILDSHPRKLIRAKVASILTGITGVKGVWLNRAKKLYDEEMPALIVYTRNEQAEMEIAAPRQYQRMLRLAVEVIVEQDADAVSPDDLVDDISLEIERRIMRDETLAGLAADVRLSDTELESNHDGANQAAAARITFEVAYWTDAVEDQTELDDFRRVKSEMKPGNGIEDTPAAVDTIELFQD